MKKIKLVLIALIAIMLFPVVNGMGCDFSFEYQIAGHTQFGSCKFGQFTLIDYPEPEKNNGYMIMKGLYFYAFGNAAILMTGHEDYTKRITDAVMDSLNLANRTFWYQFNVRPLSENTLLTYTDLPKQNLFVIPYKGTLAITDTK